MSKIIHLCTRPKLYRRCCTHVHMYTFACTHAHMHTLVCTHLYRLTCITASSLMCFWIYAQPSEAQTCWQLYDQKIHCQIPPNHPPCPPYTLPYVTQSAANIETRQTNAKSIHTSTANHISIIQSTHVHICSLLYTCTSHVSCTTLNVHACVQIVTWGSRSASYTSAKTNHRLHSQQQTLKHGKPK